METFRLANNVSILIQQNPFNNSTTLVYDVSENGRVSINVYDVLGLRVAKLLDETREAGRQRLTWHPQGIKSGIYIITMTTKDFRESKKSSQ